MIQLCAVTYKEQVQARGLGAPTRYRRLWFEGANGVATAMRERANPVLEERSAERSESTHAAKVQNRKFSMWVMKGGAWQRQLEI
eukprot:6177787-Pleurochrysis_carterae.AAC.3